MASAWRCRVCASRREQSPLRASARVVLELDFVRAGSRKVPLGHLRSSCLRGVMCERARTQRILSRIGRNMRFVGEVELVCAGSSNPLLGAWMWSSTCAASAAPVAQTAASFKNEQKSPRPLQVLFLRCSPHRCPFEQLGNPAFCQHLGGHLRGAHRANRMSGSAH